MYRWIVANDRDQPVTIPLDPVDARPAMLPVDPKTEPEDDTLEMELVESARQELEYPPDETDEG